MQETMGERIKKKRRDFHLTQTELAKRIQGVTHGAISQWESDTTKPNAENLYELSRIFKCDFVWLLKGEGVEEQEGGVSHININESTDIPVFNADSLIKSYDAQSHKQKSGEYIMTDLEVSDAAFAVRLCDDSMYPVFQQGDVVIIDPQIAPEPGEFVLAKQNENFLFRKYKLEYKLNHFNVAQENIPDNPRFTVSWLPSQYRYLMQKATLQHDSLSSIVRDIVQEYITKNPVLNNDDVQALYQSNYQLLRLGRNINQIARQLNSIMPQSLITRELNELLPFIRQHTEKVGRVLRKQGKPFKYRPIGEHHAPTEPTD